MSGEIVYTSISIPKSKKRQRIDDVLESHISDLSMSSAPRCLDDSLESRISHLRMSYETRCLDDLDESLTRIEIPQQTETGIFLLPRQCNSKNLVNANTVNRNFRIIRTHIATKSQAFSKDITLVNTYSG